MISIVKQSDSPNKKNSANFTGVDKDIQTYERDLLDYLTPIHDQNSQQTRNRSVLPQSDKPHLRKNYN